MIGASGEPQRNRSAQRPPFPLPRWARVVAFIGLYVLTVIGLHGLEGSLEALLGRVGMEGASLRGVATMASVFIALMGLAGLLYADGNRRNRGLYLTACSLVGILAAFAVAAVAHAVLRTAAPDLAATTPGQLAVLAATALSLGATAVISIYAARRRQRMAREEADELPGRQYPPPTS